MNNKSLRRFASSCIRIYSTKNGDQYDLQVSDLPDCIRHEFASLIIANEPAYASEASGSDNRLWESKMLPALIKYLQNSTNPDQSIEFKNIWTDSITSYMHNFMQELIDDEIGDYNQEFGFNQRNEMFNEVLSHACG